MKRWAFGYDFTLDLHGGLKHLRLNEISAFYFRIFRYNRWTSSYVMMRNFFEIRYLFRLLYRGCILWLLIIIILISWREWLDQGSNLLFLWWRYQSRALYFMINIFHYIYCLTCVGMDIMIDFFKFIIIILLNQMTLGLSFFKLFRRLFS